MRQEFDAIRREGEKKMPLRRRESGGGVGVFTCAGAAGRNLLSNVRIVRGSSLSPSSSRLPSCPKQRSSPISFGDSAHESSAQSSGICMHATCTTLLRVTELCSKVNQNDTKCC
jgi:hypothetical protein